MLTAREPDMILTEALAPVLNTLAATNDSAHDSAVHMQKNGLPQILDVRAEI